MTVGLDEPRFKTIYRDQLRDELQAELELPNVMMVPLYLLAIGAVLAGMN